MSLRIAPCNLQHQHCTTCHLLGGSTTPSSIQYPGHKPTQCHPTAHSSTHTTCLREHHPLLHPVTRPLVQQALRAAGEDGYRRVWGGVRCGDSAAIVRVHSGCAATAKSHGGDSAAPTTLLRATSRAAFPARHTTPGQKALKSGLNVGRQAVLATHMCRSEDHTLVDKGAAAKVPGRFARGLQAQGGHPREPASREGAGLGAHVFSKSSRRWGVPGRPVGYAFAG